jgi:hypothetical protein
MGNYFFKLGTMICNYYKKPKNEKINTLIPEDGKL